MSTDQRPLAHCGNCGRGFTLAAKFCGRCGHPAPPAVAAEVAAQAVPASGADRPLPIPQASMPPAPVASAPVPAPPLPPPAFAPPSAGPSAIAPPTVPARAAFESVQVFEPFKVGWQRFSKDPSTTLVPVLVGSLLQGLVLMVLWFGFFLVLFGVLSSAGSDGAATGVGVAAFVGYFVLYLAMFILFQVVFAGWVKAGLASAAGSSIGLGDCYAGWRKSQVVVTALLLSLAVGLPFVVLGYLPHVGGLLAILGGASVMFLGQFAILLVVDQDLSGTEAIAASVRLVTRQPVQILAFDALVLVVYFLGVLACGIGSLVSTPVVLIAYGHMLRELGVTNRSGVRA